MNRGIYMTEIHLYCSYHVHDHSFLYDFRTTCFQIPTNFRAEVD